MDNRELLNAIEKEIRILDAHIARLRSRPGEVHGIDIDVLADRLKSLYAMVLELETSMAIKAITDEPGDPISEPEPEPESEPESEPEPEFEPEPELDPELEPVSVPESQPVAAAALSEAERRDPVPESEPDAAPGTRDPSPKLTADLFSGPTTISDAYQAKEDKSIAARVVPQAVDDLKRAIGINDKFLFINELFNGSPGEYNETVERLNTAGSLEKAQETMEQCRSRYEWAEQSEAYHRLKKIVNAKFIGS